jgi:outer membrane lipoprotein-sorting protein
MNTNRRTFLAGVAAALAASPVARLASAQGDPVPDALTPYRERYASLQSYADTGKVVTEQQWPGAPVVKEGGSFTTFFRAPRNFYFDFKENPDTGNGRLVIWCDGGDFQSWWSDTGVHDVYDGGRGALAFLLGVNPTMGSSNVIPTLLFPKANLAGSVGGLIDVRDEGEVQVGGKPYLKLAADIVVTGSVSRERPTTIWVGPKSKLIFKVLEDSAPDEGLNRRTTLFAPKADIDIPDDRFTFAVPG